MPLLFCPDKKILAEFEAHGIQVRFQQTNYVRDLCTRCGPVCLRKQTHSHLHAQRHTVKSTIHGLGPSRSFDSWFPGNLDRWIWIRKARAGFKIKMAARSEPWSVLRTLTHIDKTQKNGFRAILYYLFEAIYSNKSIDQKKWATLSKSTLYSAHPQEITFLFKITSLKGSQISLKSAHFREY